MGTHYKRNTDVKCDKKLGSCIDNLVGECYTELYFVIMKYDISMDDFMVI